MKLIYGTLMVGAISALPQVNQCLPNNDADGDGYTSTSSGGDDCNDNDPSINPGAEELCDGVDNDCDAQVDEEAVDAGAYYLDMDGDGYGAGEVLLACETPAGYVTESGDCDDTSASSFPGAPETVGDTADSNCNSHWDYVTTTAGTGVPGYSGDGGAATSAQMQNPFSVVRAPDGSLFIADSANHRVRKVDAVGMISTYAGTGVAGYDSDNVPATTSKLNYPRGLALDQAGNLFIADSSNQRIRKVDAATGKISTYAGTGIPGFGGDGGAATSASMAYPYGLALDLSGNLVVVDSNNHRIRSINASTQIITTIIGNGSAGYNGDGGSALSASLNYPRSVSLDMEGNFYIADTSNYRIRKVSGGLISTVAGSGVDGYGGDKGPATSAKLNDPYGVSVDTFGNVFIADTDNNRVRKVNAADGQIDTVAGTGIAGYSGNGVEGGSTSAQVYLPYSVFADQEDLLIADSRNGSVRWVQW